MSPTLIAKQQLKDKHLQRLLKFNKNQDQYYLKKVEGIELIHYRKKVYVPTTLCSRIIVWYHEYLVHLGQTRMEETIRRDVREIVKT